MSEDIHTPAAPYVLDALGKDDRVLFEQHLPRCAGCSAEVAELREAVVKLSVAVAAAPPPGLNAVMASIAQVEQLPSPPEAVESTTNADPAPVVKERGEENCPLHPPAPEAVPKCGCQLRAAPAQKQLVAPAA